MSERVNFRVTNDFEKTRSAINRLGNSFKSNASAFSSANNAFNRMRGSMRNLNQDANRTSQSMKGLANNMKLLGMGVSYFLVNKMAEGTAKVIQSSMDAIEVLNMFEVSMGQLAEETDKELTALSNLTGLDLTNLRQATGTFTLLAKSMGMNAEAASKLGMNATKMALDLSSLFNIPIQQVMDDLRSGLIGQTETVYKYGMDLTEASLNQEALRLGMDKSVRNMTQGEKMFLRMTTAMRQASGANGDFARTIETPANQIRLLGENLTTLARTIGNTFMPVIGAVIPYVRAFVMVLTELFKMLGAVFGVQANKAKNMEDKFGGVGASVDDTTGKVGKLKKAVDDLSAPFDELNAVNIDTSGGASGGGGAGLGGGLTEEMSALMAEYDMHLSNIRSKATDIRDRIMEWLGFQKIINEDGSTTWKMYKNTYTNIEKIRDGLILISTLMTTIAGIKLAKAFMDTKFFKEGVVFLQLWRESNFVTAMSALSPMLANFATALGLTLGTFMGIVGLLAIFGARLYYLWQTSEEFRVGIQRIGEIFMDLWGIVKDSIIDPLANSFKILGEAILNAFPEPLKQLIASFFDGFMKLIKNSKLDFGDLLLTLAGIGLLFTPAAPFGIALMTFQLITTAVRMFGSVSKEKFEEVKNAIMDNISSAMEFVKTVLNLQYWLDLFQFVVTACALKLSEFIVYWSGAISGWWTAHVTPWFTTEKWMGIFNNIKTGFANMWSGFVTWWNNSAVGSWWNNNVAPWFSVSKWLSLGQGIVEGIRQTFKNACNVAIGLVNQLINWLNNKLTISFEGFSSGLVNIPAFNIQLVKIPPITPLAKGGMLDAGALFQAGEAGAELIGSYNNKTTVMPLENSGFVEAMYRSVYDAVTSAMQSDGFNQTTVLELDGEVIYKNQQKVSAQKGVSFGLGEFAR